MQDHSLNQVIKDQPEFKEISDKEKIFSTSKYRTEEEYRKALEFPHFFEDILLGDGIQNYVNRVCIVLKNIIESRDECQTSQNARLIHQRLTEMCRTHGIDCPRIYPDQRTTRSRNKKRELNETTGHPRNKRIALLEITQGHVQKRQACLAAHEKSVAEKKEVVDQIKCDLDTLANEFRVKTAELEVLSKRMQECTNRHEHARMSMEDAISRMDNDRRKFEKIDSNVKQILEEI